jgi:uncharacterized membrane protein HdeD (DUF308 family)
MQSAKIPISAASGRVLTEFPLWDALPLIDATNSSPTPISSTNGVKDLMTINATPIKQELKTGFNWAIVLGVLFNILGLAALAQPFLASIATELYLGWVFAFLGGAQLVYAIKTRQEGGFWVKLLLSIMTIVAAFLLLSSPLAGVATLALIVGGWIFADGLANIFWGFQNRSQDGWILILLNGIVGVIFGAIIWFYWPLNAPFLIGLLVGIRFIFTGMKMIFLGTTGRQVIGSIDAAEQKIRSRISQTD